MLSGVDDQIDSPFMIFCGTPDEDEVLKKGGQNVV